MSATWQVGVDIGGTFTDIVAVDAAGGALREAKVKSVAGEPEASLDAALAAVGLDWAVVDDLMHGTTLATNAIVQDRLAPVALIATEGFGDVLAIARQNRRELYRLDVPPKLPPLVPEALRLEVRERVDGDGGVSIALDGDEAIRVTEALVALGVDAVAIALLNAYANPVHEKALAARLNGAVRHVALSHQVNPEAREFERTSATVLNAALMPLTGEYLDKTARPRRQSHRGCTCSTRPAAWLRPRRCAAGRWRSPFRVRRPASRRPAARRARWRSITRSASIWAARPPTSA